MVDQAKVMIPTTRITGPSTGIWEKARVVSWPPSATLSMLMLGFFIMVLTSTRPVMRQTTTVSQKGAGGGHQGLPHRLPASGRRRPPGGPEPMPDSLENRPRATPKRRAMSRHMAHQAAGHRAGGEGQAEDGPDGGQQGCRH